MADVREIKPGSSGEGESLQAKWDFEDLEVPEDDADKMIVAWHMEAAGYNQYEIAAKLEKNQSWVSKSLKRMRERQGKKNDVDVFEKRDILVPHYEFVLKEAYKAYAKYGKESQLHLIMKAANELADIFQIKKISRENLRRRLLTGVTMDSLVPALDKKPVAPVKSELERMIDDFRSRATGSA